MKNLSTIVVVRLHGIYAVSRRHLLADSCTKPEGFYMLVEDLIEVQRGTHPPSYQAQDAEMPQPLYKISAMGPSWSDMSVLLLVEVGPGKVRLIPNTNFYIQWL